MGQDTLAFLDRFIDSLESYRLESYRQSQRLAETDTLVDEEQIDEEQRRSFIRSLRGMAAQSTLSSDDFARRKQAEIDWEERNS